MGWQPEEQTKQGALVALGPGCVPGVGTVPALALVWADYSEAGASGMMLQERDVCHL